MNFKLDKKLLFNIYTIPAVLFTFLNLFVIITEFDMMTWGAVGINIAFWFSGILLYKNKNFASLIAIIPIVISFIISVRSFNNIFDPYWTHGLFFVFYIICDLVVFYKKDEVKSGVKKIITILLGIVIIVSFSFCITDYIRIKNEKMPIFMILIDASDEAEYIGLGYRFSLDNGISYKEGIMPNSEYKFGDWFSLFKYERNLRNSVVNIIDRVEEDGLVCAEALDYFYEDRDNIYYFNCLKKDKIVVEYEDGSEKFISDAFLVDITLDDLDKYDINYITEKKISTIGELSSINVENSSDVELLIDYNEYNDLISDGYLPYYFKNNSENDTYFYGNPFFIEIKQGNDWYELLPPNELLFTLPLYGLKPDEVVSKQIDLYFSYGQLEKGIYRLVKDFDTDNNDIFYVAVEFAIE